MKNLKKLSKEELTTMSCQIISETERRDNVEWRNTTKTYDELLKCFSGYGYVIPTEANFWRVWSAEYNGCYGYQVGCYVHSCHVDTTDFIVLLLNDKKHNFIVDSFDEMSLEKVWYEKID